MNKYSFMDKEDYDLAYGVEGFIKEKENAYQKLHIRNVIIGTLFLIMCPLPYLFFQVRGFNDVGNNVYLSASLILLFIAIGTSSFVYTFVRKEGYEKIIENTDKIVIEKNQKLEKIKGVFWLSVLVIYLIYSFLTRDWGRSWIVWPVAGIISIIINIIFDPE